MTLPTCYTPCPVSLSDKLVGENCGRKTRIFLNPCFAKADFLTVRRRNNFVQLLRPYGRTRRIHEAFPGLLAKDSASVDLPLLELHFGADQSCFRFARHALCLGNDCVHKIFHSDYSPFLSWIFDSSEKPQGLPAASHEVFRLTGSSR
jgi:hypothetical protein